MATDFTQVSQELAQDMELLRNSVQRGAGGLSEIGKAGSQAAYSVNQLRKDLDQMGTTFVKSIYSSNSALEALAENTQEASTIMAAVAKEFGIMGKIAAYFIDKTGKIVAQGVKDLDTAFKAYGELSKQGATGAGGLTEFMETASKLGYSINSLGEFNSLLTQNSESLAIFGDGVKDGLEKVVKIREDFNKTGFTGELIAMGVRLDDINVGITRYARMLAITGQQHRMDQNQITAGTKAYIKELDFITKLTGKNAEQQQAEYERRMLDERNLIAEYQSKQKEKQLRDTGFKEQAEFIEQQRILQNQLLKLVPEGMRAEFGAVFNGIITSREMGSLMQLLPKTVEYITKGGRDIVEFSKLSNKELQDQFGEGGVLASMAYTKSTAEATGLSLKDLMDFMNTTAVAMKGQAVTGAKTASTILDPLTNSVAQLEETFRKAQVGLQKLLRDGITPLTDFIADRVNSLKEFGIPVPARPFEKQMIEAGIVPGPDISGMKKQLPGKSVPSGVEGQPAGTVPSGEAEAVSPATYAPSAPGGPAPVKAPQPPTTPPGAATKTSQVDPLARFNFGGQRAERTGGGEASATLIEMAGKVADLYPDLMITAFDDLFHRRRFPDSAHTKGRAMDFALIGDNRPRNIEESTAIKKMLQDMGLINVRDEYFADKDKNTTGPHFHAEVSARFGRLTSGPLSGYRATLHGNEVVIPLSNGTTIPLDMTPLIRNLDSNAQALAAQITRLDDLIMLSRDTLNVNRKMLSYRT
jgi:hypothetical protein